MKKKTMLFAVLAISLIACFSFIACSEEEPHTHTFDSNYSITGDEHYKECVDGDGEIDVGSRGYHTFVWKTTATEHYKECSVCNYAIDRGKHDYDDNFVCKTCGYEHSHSYDDEYVCTVCSYKHTHTFSEVLSCNESHHWHADTCGHNMKTDDIAHNIINGVCKDCGFTENLQYELSLDEKQYIVTGLGGATAKDITIPSYYKELPVTTINVEAFKDTDIKSLTIPSTLTVIQQSAFEGCKQLSKVSFGQGLTTIGSHAFEGCDALNSIVLPESLRTIDQYAFRYCFNLQEIYNLSSTRLEIGSSSNGYVAYYAIGIYDKLETQSKIVEQNGFIFYKNELPKDENSKADDQTIVVDYLLGINGDIGETLTLPDNDKPYVIHKFAFANSALKTVVFNDKVNKIGEGAFLGCENLTAVEMPESIEAIDASAFEDCKSLDSLTIGTKVKTIGDKAFAKCVNLNSVVIPDEATSIGSNAFENCAQLNELKLGAKVESIGERAFAECVSLNQINIPDSVKTIGRFAFYNCNKVETVTLGKNVVTINEGAFSDCRNLKFVNNLSQLKLTLGSIDNGFITYYAVAIFTDLDTKGNVETSGDFVFFRGQGENAVDYLIKYTGNETELTLPQNSKPYVIHKYAFSDNDTLTSVKIPLSVSAIDDGAFENCSELTEVVIGSKENANDNNKGVKRIGKNAFYKCEKLNKLTINSLNLEVIDIGAFAYCLELIKVVIPKSEDTQIKTTIIQGAFYGCDKLEEIVLPSTVNKIDNAFMYCKALKKVYFDGSASEWNYVEVVGNELKSASIYFYSEKDPYGDNSYDTNLYWHYDSDNIVEWQKPDIK